MSKKPKLFATEADLCARFIACVDAEKWTVLAEYAGWDILLVRKEDGFQIGIEAKLKLNALVLTQTLESYGAYAVDHAGPDCRAILVPENENGYERIASYIGITVIRVYDPNSRYRYSCFHPDLPSLSGGHGVFEEWHEWTPARRHPMPEYIPDVVAGKPSPVQLTDWKIKAIKICVTLEKRGYVTRADFKHLKIDHRRWLTSGMGWLAIQDGRYVKGEYFPNFKAQHPVVYEQIAADSEKWMLKALITAPNQEELL
jgi:hypothetical protein